MEIQEVQIYAAALKISIESAIQDFVNKTGAYPIINIQTEEQKSGCGSVLKTNVTILTELA